MSRTLKEMVLDKIRPLLISDFIQKDIKEIVDTACEGVKEWINLKWFVRDVSAHMGVKPLSIDIILEEL